VYRYDARTALVHEIGSRAAPFVAPHDRATIVAWRLAPASLAAAPNSWIRLRFSVTTALVPETDDYRRAAVPVHAWLLEPDARTTRCTTWGVEELPPTAPPWLLRAHTDHAKSAAAAFPLRVAKWRYKDADPADLAAPDPDALNADWLQLAEHDNDRHARAADDDQD